MEKSLGKFDIHQKLVPDFFVRERISSLFNEAVKYKVVFVSAMCGYDKTTEVLAWSKQVDKKFYFITLNDGDTCESLCQKINDECNTHYISLDQILLTENPIQQIKERVIIIDNFEYVANNNKILNYFVNIINNVNNIRFIIVSEGCLPNQFEHFLYTNHLVCIKNNDLSFTENEIKLYLEKNNCFLVKEELDTLYDYSAGVPVYLRAFLSKYRDNNNIFDNELFNLIKKDMFIYLEYKLSLILPEEFDRMLVMISRFDELNEKLISKILKTSKAKEILTQIYNSTCILQETNIGQYVIAEFFRKYYLHKELSKEEFQELNEYYVIMAQKYIATGNYVKEIEYYIKAQKYDMAIQKIRERTLLDSSRVYDEEILKITKKIPSEYMNNSVLLSWYSYISALRQYNIPEINRLYTEINERVLKTPKNDKHYYEILKIGIWVNILFPSNSPKLLIKSLKIFILEQQKNLKYIPEINLTESQPSLLSGRKDFSELCVHAKMFLPILEKFIEQAHFIKIDGFMELVLAEYYYQQNNINEALNFMGKGISKARNNNNFRLEFPGDVLNLKILFLTSQKKLFYKIMEDTKNKFKTESNKKFFENLEAEEIRFDLKLGKVENAIAWLDKEAPNIIENFNMLEKYRYTIKARVYIAIGEYTGALIVLKKMEIPLVENQRWFSVIENYILQAICFENDGSDKMAMEYIENAFILAQKYKYLRVFADEGTVMYKILTNFKSRCTNHKINQVFLNEVIRETKKFGDNHPLLYALNSEKNSFESDSNTNLNLKKIDNLSSSEKNILNLICGGLKNGEIAKEMNISISTVKTHINHIFSKLGVENRVQAINEARKKDIV